MARGRLSRTSRSATLRPRSHSSIAQSLIDSGSVDVLELGVPFSDPIADGPVIQAAVDRSLKAGMNTDIAFEIAGRLEKKVPDRLPDLL